MKHALVTVTTDNRRETFRVSATNAGRYTMKNTSRRNAVAAELKMAFSLIREGAPFAELLSIAHLNGAQAITLGHTHGLVWAEKNIKPMAIRLMNSAWKKHKRLVRIYA